MHLYNHLLGQEVAFSVLSATLGVFSHPHRKWNPLASFLQEPRGPNPAIPSLCVSVALALKGESYTMYCMCYFQKPNPLTKFFPSAILLKLSCFTHRFCFVLVPVEKLEA